MAPTVEQELRSLYDVLGVDARYAANETRCAVDWYLKNNGYSAQHAAHAIFEAGGIVEASKCFKPGTAPPVLVVQNGKLGSGASSSGSGAPSADAAGSEDGSSAKRPRTDPAHEQAPEVHVNPFTDATLGSGAAVVRGIVHAVTEGLRVQLEKLTVDLPGKVSHCLLHPFPCHTRDRSVYLLASHPAGGSQGADRPSSVRGRASRS